MVDTTEEHKILNVWFTVLCCTSAMDEIENTSYYRREFKQKGKLFKEEIRKATAQLYGPIFGVNDRVMFDLMSMHEEFIQNMMSMRPEDVGIVNCFLEQYKKDPEKVMELLQIGFETENSE